VAACAAETPLRMQPDAKRSAAPASPVDYIEHFTQSKFTPQLAAANDGVVYLQKGEGPQSRFVAGHLTTAVRLPRAR
jgi:hypothetical protein